MADDDYPDVYEPYFANHPDSPSTSEDDRYNDRNWTGHGPGPEDRQSTWERRQPVPENPEGWELVVRGPPHERHDQMDVTSSAFPLAPTTTMNPQLLHDSDEAINATQGFSIPEQIAAMNAALQRTELDDAMVRVVDGQPQPPSQRHLSNRLSNHRFQRHLVLARQHHLAYEMAFTYSLGNFGQTTQDNANSRQAVPVEMSGTLSSSSGAGSQSLDNGRDNWSSESYQRAASFVPRMTQKVVQLLDVQSDDVILDIGCGDGVLTRQIAEQLKDGTGIIWGIDSSPAMIEAASHHLPNGPISQRRHGYSVMDATKLFDYLQCTDLTTLDRHELGIADYFQPVEGRYTKIFSNAALHWILRNPSTRENVFLAIFQLLSPGGHLVFEMGGHGNVSELRTALLSATSHRVGIYKAREADPWFFADEAWLRDMLIKAGFLNLDIETEFRPTRATAREDGALGGGGIEGWVRLMGKEFLNAVKEEERESVVKEVCDTLKTVCTTESGEEWMGYVRLRVKAMKPGNTSV